MNWEKGRFFVRSPKTEHRAGKEDRMVPIFPELKRELETLFSMPQSKGKEFVINHYRDSTRTLGTPLLKIAKTPGASQAFQGVVEKSCETEFADVGKEFGVFGR